MEQQHCEIICMITVIEALTKIFNDIIQFIPNLINGLIILFVGYFIATFVRWLLRSLLQRLKFDPLMERTGVIGALKGLGIRVPLSSIVGQIVFLLLIVSFFITATRLMGLEAVAHLLEQLLTYLPNIIAAAIVFLLGGMAAQFAGNLISAALLASGLSYGNRVGHVVQYLISMFVLILALSQLGIDTAILVTAVTIMIAAFGLAIALALGLGARSIVLHVLSGLYLKQRFTPGTTISLGKVNGNVESIGSVNTVVRTSDGTVVIPNSTLIDAVVQSPTVKRGSESP